MKKIARGQITITALYDGEPGPQGPQGPQGEPGTPGADGTDGSDGSDGVGVEVRNAPLVFDTDATGLVPSSSLAAQTAQVRLMAGGRNITGAVTSYASDNSGSRLCQSATTRVSGSDAYLSVRLTAITAQTTEAGTASAMAGYARVRIAYAGTNYYAQVPFQVNVAKMTGALMANTTQLRAEYTALRSDLGSSSPATLAAYTTALTQNAEKIALEASRNAVGRRNLLPGTALTMRKGAPAMQLYQQTSVYDYSGLQHHPSKDGMNCLRVTTSHPTADSYQYAGLYWRGGDGGGNIRIEQGKRYTLSVWVMANTTAVGISLEAYAKESESSTDRLGTNMAKVQKWGVAKAGEWELFTAAIDTTGLGHDYLEVVAIAVSQTVGLTATAYFCQPQLEEGDTATPWTPSPKDGDRLGGNLLDDTLSLTPTLTGSNLMYANGVTPQAYEGTHATAHAESTAEGSLAEIMQFDMGGKISQGEDYVFSFLARGSGMICTYLYYATDGDPMVMRETVDGEVALLCDGATYFQLTSEWRRYWVHWRTLSTAQPHYLLLRAWNVCQATICQPKLEEAATMTPYTERGTDLVSRAEAKRAGMELTADGILLYGERIRIKNGDATAALFENGRLNAALIDADTINVKHLWARDSNGANALGHFGNYDIAAARLDDNTMCPLWVGADNAKDAPFRVSKDGYVYAEMIEVGRDYGEDHEGKYVSKFRFGSSGMYSGGGAEGTASMTLNNNYISFLPAKDDDGGAYLFVGEHAYKASSGYNALLDISQTRKDGAVAKLGLVVEMSGASDIYQSTSALSGNFAIYALKGMYGGFRPNTRTISKSTTLSTMDNVVIVSGNTAQVTLALPNNAERGQTMWVISTSNKGLIISGNGKSIFAFGRTNTQVNTSETYAMLTFVYDGNNWYCNSLNA